MLKYNKTVIAGHFVVSFDRVINGFLSVVMAPLFFAATDDGILQLLSSYASFAALYLTGPVGSMLLGRLGDRFGRKRALLLSIAGVAIPVFSIGVLPTYASIGLFAPVALIFLRMIQGVFSGAEYAGVLIHNHESGNHNASDSANIISCGGIGGLAGAVVCWGITYNESLGPFWRLPFLIGGLFALGVLVMRTKISEPDDFLLVIAHQQVSKYPIRDMFRGNRYEVLVGIAICAVYTVSSSAAVFFGNRLFQQAGYSVSESMLFNVISLIWGMISVSICGKLADKVGVIRQVKCGVLSLCILAFPICALITGELTLTKIYAYMLVMTLLSSIIISCSVNYVLNLFPVSCRYSGFSLTNSIGDIAGGFTPFMMLLFSASCGSNLWCALWICIITIPTFLLITSLEKRRARKAELI